MEFPESDFDAIVDKGWLKEFLFLNLKIMRYCTILKNKFKGTLDALMSDVSDKVIFLNL